MECKTRADTGGEIKIADGWEFQSKIYPSYHQHSVRSAHYYVSDSEQEEPIKRLLIISSALSIRSRGFSYQRSKGRRTHFLLAINENIDGIATPMYFTYATKFKAYLQLVRNIISSGITQEVHVQKFRSLLAHIDIF